MNVPRLPGVLRPEPGENIRGFLRRLAGANGYRSLRRFLSAIGLEPEFGPTSVDRGWQTLASATGLDNEEINQMRWRPWKRNHHGPGIFVAGVRTAKGYVHCGTVRLCPLCLRETGIVRDFWLFSVVWACPRHGTLLNTNCVCGRPLLQRQKRQRQLWQCACGVEAHNLSTKAAPSAALRVANNMAARIGAASGYTCENELRAPFEALCAHDLMVLVHELGVAGATPASEDPPITNATPVYRGGSAEAVPALDVTLMRLRAAIDVIEGWPNAFAAMLENVSGRNAEADPSTVNGVFATEIGYRLIRPARGVNGLPLSVLREAVERYLGEQYGAQFRARNLSTTDIAARRIYRLFNVSQFKEVVKASTSEGLLGRVLRRVLQSLSECELTLGDADLADLVRDRAVSLYHTAAASLSMKAVCRAVEGREDAIASENGGWWDHPQLIPAIPKLYGLRYADRPAYAREAVEAVLSHLGTVARRVQHPRGLRSLIGAGRNMFQEPWCSKADVLLEILAERLIVYTMVERPTMCDLLVSVDDLSRFCSERSPANRSYAACGQINVVLDEVLGSAGRITDEELGLLSRAGLVRFRTERKICAKV